MKNSVRSLVGLMFVCSVSMSVQAAPFSHLVVFGDSLSDTGNFYTGSGNTFPISPPYAQGRFTNGPNWVETLAGHYQLQTTPSLLGGTNFAVGAAGTGPGVSDVNGNQVPNMGMQLGFYIGAGAIPTGNELFVVWGGANDLFIDQAPSPNDSAHNISSYVNALVGMGAKHLLVPNLPPLGLTPKGSVNAPAANGWATVFNAQLSLDLAQIRLLNPSAYIHELDVFGIVTQAATSPATLGLTNTVDPFVDLMTGQQLAPVGSDPNEYIFWDNQHPTAAAHQIIGLAAIATVPEPATLLLLSTGMMGLVKRKR